MKKIIFILILFITSCGYKPIFSNNNIKNFEFSKINSEGEKDINRIILSTISLKENRTNTMLNELFIKSSFETNETSKNKKGQVNSYRTNIIVNLVIKKNKKIIKDKNFSEEFFYNTKNNKFELVEYQADIKNDLINKIVEDIILFLNL